MDIYFDNAATTKISEAALSKMIFMSSENYGNPSSVHKLGLLAEREITNARINVASIIGAKEDEIFFTSGATEANNLCILGCAKANVRTGKHIITQKTEHASVIESIKVLEEEGFEVSYLENNKSGEINLNDLKKMIKSDTIMVSIMHVNNETGSIADIENIGKIIKQTNKDTLFHTDCVQSFCKFDIDVNKCNIDMLTFSGHKLHAPKGVGGMYLRKGVKQSPRVFGGSQQKKVRPGTENIIGITSLSESITELYKNRNENYEVVCKLKDCLIEIQNEIENVTVNVENGSAYVVSMSFVGVKGEVLVHALEEKNIYCSTGSACHKGAGSAILQNYGLPSEITESALRVSFTAENTIEEVIALKDALKEIVPVLRRFKKR